ncbi:MAG: hypothetical protein H8E72_01965 [Candidatus Marinimicrobia bacterium]|nr:hypothetical protein [Candidatus Neomarinimicrobiota bacterium]
MNCYEFENHISEYIDGELKMGTRKGFISHKSDCILCTEKLEQIVAMLKEMPNMAKMKTSGDFLSNLNDKIESYENRSTLKMNQFFGFDYVSAIGLAAAMVLVVGASYLLVTEDSIPIVDLDKISTKSGQSNQNPQITLNNQNGFIADQDSSHNDDEENQYNMPIRLVGGSK